MRIETRIKNYWDKRSEDFGRVRQRELESTDADAWLNYIEKKISARSVCKVLDVGTGAGFFAVLLSRRGHEVTGIDLSTDMLKAAERNLALFDCRARLLEMSADDLKFDDESFDVVISRNLTWTLPDVEGAYREWRRVLKVGGVLMNFDSDYGDQNFSDATTCHHAGLTNAQLDECGSIKNVLEISRHHRPAWDVEFLRSIGFDVTLDDDIAPLVRRDKSFDFDRVPLFAITAVRSSLRDSPSPLR